MRYNLLMTSVPVDFQVEEIRLKEPDWPLLLSLFRDFEFSSLMKLIPTDAFRKRDYETVFSLDSLQEIAKIIEHATCREFSFSIEPSISGGSGNRISDSLVGIAVTVDKDRPFYIPLSHSYTGAPPQIKKEDMVRILSPIFKDEKISKIGHNLKYNILVLRGIGISVKGPLFDTMIASYLLNPNKQNHNLEEVTLEYLSKKRKTKLTA